MDAREDIESYIDSNNKTIARVKKQLDKLEAAAEAKRKQFEERHNERVSRLVSLMVSCYESNADYEGRLEVLNDDMERSE